MAFRLLENRVAVIPDEDTDTTESGLYVPQSGQEIMQYGTVAAVGPGSYQMGVFVPTKVAVGDKVFWNRYSGSEVKIGASEFKVLSANEIVGVVDGEE